MAPVMVHCVIKAPSVIKYRKCIIATAAAPAGNGFKNSTERERND